MSESLVKIEGKPVVQDDASISSLTKTADYLPQIRIYGSEATIVKEGKFPMGHLGCYFTQDNIADLDTQFDCLVIAYRPRASLFGGDQPISYYGKVVDGEWTYSDSFISTKERAMAKEQSYLVGLEFLFWVPSIKTFALFFMGNPTLRRESPNLKALVEKAATLKIKLIKTSKHTWHGVEVLNCKVPFDLPDSEALNQEVAKFYNPVDSSVEVVADQSGSERVAAVS